MFEEKEKNKKESFAHATSKKKKKKGDLKIQKMCFVAQPKKSYQIGN